MSACWLLARSPCLLLCRWCRRSWRWASARRSRWWWRWTCCCSVCRSGRRWRGDRARVDAGAAGASGRTAPGPPEAASCRPGAGGAEGVLPYEVSPHRRGVPSEESRYEVIPWLSDEITEDDVEFRPIEAVCGDCHLTFNRHLGECPDHG